MFSIWKLLESHSRAAIASQRLRFSVAARVLYGVVSLSIGIGFGVRLAQAQTGSDATAIANLIRAVQDSDVGVRYRAVIALGRYGQRAREAIPALITALKDSDRVSPLSATVGNAAARVLGHEIGASAVPALLSALGDSTFVVRANALVGLEEVYSLYPVTSRPPATIELMNALTNALRDRDARIRAPAAFVAGQIGPSAAAVLPSLVTALQDREADVRADAAKSIGEIGERPNLGRGESAAKSAVPALAATLSDRDARARANAAWALGWIGPASVTALPSLIAALKDTDESVRQEVADALGLIGREAKDAVPALISALKDTDSSVRAKAADSLGAIGEPPANGSSSAVRAVPALTAALSDADDEVRENAAEALGTIGPAAKDSVPGLISAIADKDDIVQRKAIEALGSIGPPASAAVPTIAGALSSDGARIRESAAEALGRIGPSSRTAVIPLMTLLRDAQRDVRSAGIEALTVIAENLEDLRDTSVNADLRRALSAAESIRPGDEDELRRLKRSVLALENMSNGVTTAGSELSPDVVVRGLGGVNLSTDLVEIDGTQFRADTLLTRGGNGDIVLNQTGARALRKDGFFSATLRSTGQKLTLINEQGRLRLFRPYNKSYALIIAIGEYPASSGYPRLPQAVPQAKELERVLRMQGFEILKPLYDQDATSERIRSAMLKSPATKDDRLFVYFGGHGDELELVNHEHLGYIVPFDATKSELSSKGIPLTDLRGNIAGLMPAKQVLFALDSCQSGLVFTREGNKSDEERLRTLRDIEAMSRSQGRMFLTAGTGGQAAIDVNGGIFTKALIEAIQGKADQNSRGATTFYTLYEYIRSRVSDTAKSFGREQDPGQDVVLGAPGWVFVHDRSLLP